MDLSPTQRKLILLPHLWQVRIVTLMVLVRESMDLLQESRCAMLFVIYSAHWPEHLKRLGTISKRAELR